MHDVELVLEILRQIEDAAQKVVQRFEVIKIIKLINNSYLNKKNKPGFTGYFQVTLKI
jgi:hypothetical protein